MAQEKNNKFSARDADMAEPSLSGPSKEAAIEAFTMSARAAAEDPPPPIPPRLSEGDDGSTSAATALAPSPSNFEQLEVEPRSEAESEIEAPRRRVARRRAAGPSRNRIAANDDGPSIGGLIFALQQKPSNAVFKYAAVASAVWGAIACVFALLSLGSGAPIEGWLDLLSRPTTFFTFAAIIVPIGVMWVVALLAWRAEELRLRSSTMTEVAIRLAEPDRLAEQSAASLGQAVRRQVSFMNDAISRALGRAGELEAMVHNEVTLLERSYEENERKVRALIQELSGERHALVNTSDHIVESLQRLGGEIPTLIDKLSDQQVKLASVIAGAGDNLTALETTLASSVGNLESSVGERTDQLRGMLETYTAGLAMALGNRSDQLQSALDEQLQRLDNSFGDRTENLQAVFEEYARALDAALANRAEALDSQLIERTKSLDEAFAERLRLFDDSIMRSTAAIDSAVVEKTQALTDALDAHALHFSGTIGRQATDLDEALMQGISSVRRASENITRQSIKAMEGLSNQSDQLRNLSDTLLGQISNVTGRFENQGQVIVEAANTLKSLNYKIDETLQTRHADLNRTLERLSGKADEFAQFVEGYSTSLEGSISDADMRARHELQRMREQANVESERTIEDMRHRLSSVSSTMTSELGSLTERFASTSEEMRREASRAATEIAAEQARLRDQLERLPLAAQESSESMRRALQDQIEGPRPALRSDLARRLAARRDRAAADRGDAPSPPPPQSQGSRRQQGNRLEPLDNVALLHDRARARQPRSGAPAAARRRRRPRGLVARRPPGARLARRGRRPATERARTPCRGAPAAHLLQSRPRGDRLRARHGNGAGDLVAAAVRPARRDGAQHLQRRRPHRLRRGQPALPRRRRPVARHQQATSPTSSGRFPRSDLRDPTGRLTQGQLVSDAGRVYLFLAHASGRLG